MARVEKASSFLSKRNILTKTEYKQDKKDKIAFARLKELKRMEERKQKVILASRQKSYDDSRSGQFSSRVGSALGFINSPSSSLYAKSQPVFPNKPTSRFIKSRNGSDVLRRGFNYKPGRPKGTVRSIYAQYGGVYGYRKYLAAKYREQRMNMLRDRAITPQQQMALRQIEARQMAQRMSPEARTIPTTYGDVQTSNVFQDIENAANIVG